MERVGLPPLVILPSSDIPALEVHPPLLLAHSSTHLNPPLNLFLPPIHSSTRAPRTLFPPSQHHPPGSNPPHLGFVARTTRNGGRRTKRRSRLNEYNPTLPPSHSCTHLSRPLFSRHKTHFPTCFSFSLVSISLVSRKAKKKERTQKNRLCHIGSLKTKETSEKERRNKKKRLRQFQLNS